MKRKSLIMKTILLLVVLFSFSKIQAQKTVDVNVQSNVFTPKNITIDIGDTVRWTNTGGFHNVNGSTDDYASNPASFGNAIGGPGWVYSFVFNISGTYDYQCDPHFGLGMIGSIIVQNPLSNEEFNVDDFALYPVPAKNEVYISGINELSNILIYDLNGKLVLSEDLFSDDMIDIRNISNGLYIYKVISQNKAKVGRLIVSK